MTTAASSGSRRTGLIVMAATSRFVNVAARPLDNSFTMFLQVAQATPDDAQLNAIVGSVGTVPGAVYPAFAVPESLIPTEAVPPELLIAPAIPMSTIADDTGQLSIAVPSTWTDQDVAPDINDDGSDRPLVAAAPDLDGFFTDWLAPVPSSPRSRSTVIRLRSCSTSVIPTSAGMVASNRSTTGRWSD